MNVAHVLGVSKYAHLSLKRVSISRCLELLYVDLCGQFALEVWEVIRAFLLQ